MRQQCSLSGPWQFQLDPEGSLTVESLAPDREVPVPLPWQAALPELEQYSGYAWYRRYVNLAEDWLRGELLLHFGGVDYWCQVFVNGQMVGGHEGGYTPFTIPVRAQMHPGENEIAVRVYDAAQSQIVIPRWPNYPATTARPDPPFDANHIPHGKQEWYINAGGIWQDVTLTAVAATYIDHVQVTPDIHTGAAQIVIELAGALAAIAGPLQIRIAAGDDTGPTWETQVPLVAGQARYATTVTVAQPRLWNTDDPYLYNVTISLPATGGDTLSTRFGFREIRTDNGQLLLNGAPLFLLCALDQDLYPETIYTVPSEAYLRDEFAKAKKLGLNSLRCHIKPPDPRYLDLADEMGLLIWAEIPSWRTFYPKGTAQPNLLNLDDLIKRRVEATLEGMIRRDFNHPALIIWTLVNEDWGTALPLSADDRRWVRELYQRCKALDPTRLVVDNSACVHGWGPNIHVQTDLDDFHIYANIPDQARAWERSLDQFNLRPLWTFSSHGDAERTGQEPLILSEFGNWGLPSLKTLRAGAGGHDPAWFHIGPWWSPWEGEAGWPQGAEDRFQRLGLESIWGDYEGFAAATQWHQFAAMKFQIETMRRQPNLAGYVITEFTDAYWESNGLLDFDRNPKVYYEQFAAINAPDMIIPQPESYACWDDQQVRVTFYGAHYSAAHWAGARLTWTIAGTDIAGECPVANLDRGVARVLGTLSFQLPHVEQSKTVQFQFTLHTPSGQELARNTLDVLVLPAAGRNPHYRQPVAVIAHRPSGGLGTESLSEPDTALGTTMTAPPDAIPHDTLEDESAVDGIPTRGLQHTLQALGYRTTRRLTADIKVAVTNYPTADLLHWVRAGGDLLVINNQGTSPFFWTQGRGGAYSGSWISSFSWMRPEIHKRFAVVNPLSMPYQRVMPTRTILGLPVGDAAFHGDLLAGMVCGWVRHPTVHTVQFRYGQGRVIMTTFALEEALALADDAVAVALLHDLIDHLHSDACRPVLAANY
jgi:hypothetical protein